MVFCICCTEEISAANRMPHSELLFALTGPKFKEFTKRTVEFPLCVNCGRKLLQQPKATETATKRRSTTRIFWCDNCGVSMTQAKQSYFGDMEFCVFCADSNYTRYYHYCQLAEFFSREPDPRSLIYFRPTHRNICHLCKNNVNVGGAYCGEKFYCFRHAPDSMGLPPIRIIHALQ